MMEDRLFVYWCHWKCTKKNTQSLQEKCGQKKLKKMKKIFYEKIRHVSGRTYVPRSVQKTGDRSSKPIPYVRTYVRPYLSSLTSHSLYVSKYPFTYVPVVLLT